VAKVFVPPDGSCYECAMTENDYRLIHGMEVAAGSAMIFNGVANTFYTTRFQRKEDCLSHDPWPPPVDVPLSAENTADELLGVARERAVFDGPLAISLERDLVVSVDCAACGASRRVMKPRQLVSIREVDCQECGELARPTLVHAVGQDSPLAKEKLIDLGIPPYDIVRITFEEGEGVFLLAGERPGPFQVHARHVDADRPPARGVLRRAANGGLVPYASGLGRVSLEHGPLHLRPLLQPAARRGAGDRPGRRRSRLVLLARRRRGAIAANRRVPGHGVPIPTS